MTFWLKEEQGCLENFVAVLCVVGAISLTTFLAKIVSGIMEKRYTRQRKREADMKILKNKVDYVISLCERINNGK